MIPTVYSKFFFFNAVSEARRFSCILLSICAIGIILALITDEDYFVFQTSPENNIKTYEKNSNKISKNDTLYIYNFSVSTIKWLEQLLGIILPEFATKKIHYILSTLKMYIFKFELYLTAIKLKRIAKTTRQFFYMMQKKTLNLHINPNETEIDSYLDCKRHMGKSWPFMWEVSQVKNDKIICEGKECYPLSSYSYLNLLRDERVQNAAIKAAELWATGNHGPRMLGGNITILRDLEKVVAKFYNREDTLLCATGFLACMSACNAIATEETIIFGDSRLHASLRTGLKSGNGLVTWFKHNDFEDCKKKIKQFRHKYRIGWMIVESVYSMDGDICNLPEAYKLCQQYNLKLMIDEAHGLGVLGRTGRGLEEYYDMPNCATLIVGTFSKSAASIGGFITGPQKFIDYLDFHAPGNVFSAPLPAYSAGAVIKSFEIMDNEPEIITLAQKNSLKLRKLLKTGGGYWPIDYPESKKYIVEGNPATTIIPIIFRNDIDRVMRVATSLRHKGFMVAAVAYPACSLKAPRFRITATSGLTEDIMIKFVQTLVETTVEEKPSTLLNFF